MLAAQTTLQNAQKVKEYLIKHNLLNTKYSLIKELSFIYFPLLKNVEVPSARIVYTEFSFPERPHPPEIDELLKDKLTKKELDILPHSQEIIGKILILEIPEELRKKEKAIADAFLQHNKAIETVVRKDEIHTGDYRLRKVRVLAGKKTKETIHQESGVKLKIHLEKTYYSARSAHERLRIAKLIKPGEQVLIMFSGAAPYPLVLAKNSSARHIYGIEINPLAHQLALDNLTLNNLGEKITILEGDVRKLLPTLKTKFNRIVMPLPKTGEQFLGLAFAKAKPGAFIHFYAFLGEDEVTAEKRKIKKIAQEHKANIKITKVTKCGQFSPYVFRTCFDLKIIKGKQE